MTKTRMNAMSELMYYVEENGDYKLDPKKDLTQEEIEILAIATRNRKHKLRAQLYLKKEIMLKEGLNISNVSINDKESIFDIIIARRKGIKDPYLEISTLMDSLGLDMYMKESYYIPRLIRQVKDTGKFNYMLNDEEFVTGPVNNGESPRLIKAIIKPFAEEEIIIGQTNKKIFEEVFPDGVKMDTDYIVKHIIKYTMDNYEKYYGEYPTYMEEIINSYSRKTK